MALPIAVYSAEQVRALDQRAIESVPVSGYTLMKRAGEAALRYLRARWPMSNRIVIVCGGGNNGGDGYVLARFAQAAGLEVSVISVAPAAGLKGDARQAHADFLTSGGQPRPLSTALLREGEVIIDAVLGTGLRQTVRGAAAEAISTINAAGRPVFAIDIPSGLDSDSGMPLGQSIRADSTVTFVGLKTGLFLGEGPERAGRIFFDDLEVPVPDIPQFSPRLQRITEACVVQALPRRPRQAHKGDFGRVLIIGGGVGMPGAARLCGEACLRAGAGLVTVATAPENLMAIVAGRPELICVPLGSPADVVPALERADVVAIGPGLGRSTWSEELVRLTLECAKPLVVDADALNIIAESGKRQRDNWILTPHPGEAARLLECGTGEIQNDRFAAARSLAQRHGVVTVLKGAGTVIAAPHGEVAVCPWSSAGLASGGTGDTLTGVIAGLLAQGLTVWD
ncbi:MAG TPA: NAD(P)H-hydrate dehydratase, partial [Steroidobacteraceae bacterium]|nr:NAD(P)H-hydrate dehydratase [Steroidobacteraceae bacterium]